MSQCDDMNGKMAILRLFEEVRLRFSTEMKFVVREDKSGAARYLVRWIASASLNSYQMQRFLEYLLWSASSGKGTLEEAAHIASHVPSVGEVIQAGNARAREHNVEQNGGVEHSGTSHIENMLDKMSKRLSATATKADLRAATNTILRGEDVDRAKPGPQMNGAKRRQIAAVEEYRQTHRWCTLHNACKKAFFPVAGGFASPGSLYAHLHDMES